MHTEGCKAELFFLNVRHSHEGQLLWIRTPQMNTLVIIFVKIDLVLVTAAGSKQSCHSLTSSLMHMTRLVEKYGDASNPRE